MDEIPEPTSTPSGEIAPPPVKSPSGFDPFVPPTHPPAQTGMEYTADKIGFVPNLRKEDNKFQGIAVLIGMVAGVVAGLVTFMIGNWTGVWWGDAIAGGVLGMIASTLISGMILALRNLKR